MTTPSPISEEERADLVAYLDGELDEEAARAVESKINVDPATRAEVEALKKTWDLLDYLPRPDPSPNFTNRTLDRLSVHRTQAALKSGRRKKVLLAAGWAAAVLVAGLAGFFGATRFAPKSNDEELVRDLRLIENVRFYEHAEPLEFVKELDDPTLFGEDPLD